MLKWAMFQSSPVTKDGRYGLPMVSSLGFLSFNPRPSLRTGATLYAHTCCRGLLGFNPRPSLRTGATQAHREAVAHFIVSILARH